VGRLTAPEVKAAKGTRSPLVAVTAYDAPTALLAEGGGVDIILVGDSVAMVVLGQPDTLSVTMDEMIHHCRAVVRGTQRAHIVLDMPFMSYQAGEDDAVRNAGRAIKEGHAQAVKVEGGARVAPLVARLVDIGIPVMGHVGLRPQSVNQLGGFRAQGTDAKAADAVIEDAQTVAAAGAYAIVLEKIPSELATHITSHVPVPTIGIGSGPDCDGQVLVLHDMLGMDEGFHPKHSRRYAELAGTIRSAISSYADDVRGRRFPGAEQSVAASAELREYLRGKA
jgi:3-methyl-2-oxobutanoate hydroxymethyltransferase